ncbi:MAG: hypothetical protein TRG1_312 [Flavobacteriaceae bacterium FS1-H7996/R]|nr:MAG: hypothetical protein TRG1_312 [Flavobacteriaceae bacterium FS1-H7996/R]
MINQIYVFFSKNHENYTRTFKKDNRLLDFFFITYRTHLNFSQLAEKLSFYINKKSLNEFLL